MHKYNIFLQTSHKLFGQIILFYKQTKVGEEMKNKKTKAVGPKQKRVLYVLLVVMLIACAWLMTACSNKMFDITLSKLSEVRHNLYFGETENLTATFIVGERESQYVINGYHTESVGFGVITFNLSKMADEPDLQDPKFVITINGKRFDGALEKSPIDGTYVADIQKNVNSDSDVNVKLLAGDFEEELVLTTVTDGWALDHVGALKIATKELEQDLKTFMENGEFAGEGYVKILNDKTQPNSDYVWYVSFINRHGKTAAVIIDPNSKEVLAKKTLA